MGFIRAPSQHDVRGADGVLEGSAGNECQGPGWGSVSWMQWSSSQEDQGGARGPSQQPALEELQGPDEAFPLITNRQNELCLPWPLHSPPRVVSRGNLQRVRQFAKETYVQKAGGPCQAPCLAPPSLPLQDVQPGHTPLSTEEREHVRTCTCTRVVTSVSWEHPPSTACSQPLLGLTML